MLIGAPEKAKVLYALPQRDHGLGHFLEAAYEPAATA